MRATTDSEGIVVAVIGGSGFLGQHVVRALQKAASLGVVLEAMKEVTQATKEVQQGIKEVEEAIREVTQAMKTIKQESDGSNPGVDDEGLQICMEQLHKDDTSSLTPPSDKTTMKQEEARDKPLLITEIRVLDVRQFNTCLGPEPSCSPPVTFMQCDIRARSALLTSLAGVTVVINAAYAAPAFQPALLTPGRAKHQQEVNVKGTQNVLWACLETGIRAVVHTSTFYALVGGQRVVMHGEGLTPTVHEDQLILGDYARGRLQAEHLVMEAHNSITKTGVPLATMVLRPVALYGEGDKTVVPGLLTLARAAGGVMPRIGNPEACGMAAYVGNVAEAYVCAIKQLLCGPETALQDCGGLPVYVTDDTPPGNLSSLMAPFMEPLHVVSASILPYWLVILVAWVLHLWVDAWTWIGNPPEWRHGLPPMILHYLTNSVYAPSRLRAMLCLGYRPPYTYQESLDRSLTYYRTLDLHALKEMFSSTDSNTIAHLKPVI